MTIRIANFGTLEYLATTTSPLFVDCCQWAVNSYVKEKEQPRYVGGKKELPPQGTRQLREYVGIACRQ